MTTMVVGDDYGHGDNLCDMVMLMMTDGHVYDLVVMMVAIKLVAIR